MIHHGDCLEVMATMEPESIDAIVTDPPYGLEFMGKAWDRLGDGGQVKHAGPLEHRATEAGDVYGRMRVANYGSANRKCRTCGHWEWSGTPCKCERPDFATREGRQGLLMQEWHQRWAEAAYRVAKPSAYLLAFGGTRTVHRMTLAIEDAGWIIRDMLVWGYASGFPKGKANLKPAWEPIVMARKPGPLRMLNIDECRIPFVGDETPDDREGEATAETRYTLDGGTNLAAKPGRRVRVGGGAKGTSGFAEGYQRGDGFTESGASGRWPANVILTDPIFDGAVLGVVGGGESEGQKPYDWGRHATDGAFPLGHMTPGYGDSGTYSRFFLVPKASRSDREPVLGGLPTAVVNITEGHGRGPVNTSKGDGTGIRENRARANVHPTVKPLELMRHLVRLVTPPGGTVLDPFLGSGTTGLAAEQEGFAWVGIEKEAEYVAIAEARLNGTQRGLGLVG